MKVEIVTIFPQFFDTPLATSMVAKAVVAGLIDVVVHDLRLFATDRHHTVDDTPFGGGGGMVLKPEPLTRAWDTLDLRRGRCIYLSADGRPFTQSLATELSLEPHVVLLCGHYKGVDERPRRDLIDDEISIGDYVLTGGEPAALVVVDAIARLIPGVLGDFSSAMEDSFHDGLLDCPSYTRPAEFRGEKVPEVLTSGNHQEVRLWRRRQALRRTFERRPELLAAVDLDEVEKKLVERWSRSTGLTEEESI